jgi:hypothetical protein
MKLVRFELLEAPGRARSGLIYEERVYETDGEKAIGIHELGRVRLFPPVGPVAGFRVFEALGDGLTYHHRHPQVLGPLSEIEMPSQVDGLDFDAHVCVVLQDGGTQIDPHEAPGFVLGYTLALAFRIPSVVAEDREAGGSGAPGRDAGTVIGPFLVTPEDMTEFSLPGNERILAFGYEMKVNADVVASGQVLLDPGLDRLLPFASAYSRVFPSEALAWPKLEKPELEFSELGRLLLPSDRVSLTVDGLGTLVAKIA